MPSGRVRVDFMDKVHVPFYEDGCWQWLASLTNHGYGRHGLDGEYQAHRASYRLHVGPIPKGACVLHRCDVPSCVNPAHLFIGSQAENMHDMRDKRRSAFGELSGTAKLTAAAVLEIRAAASGGESHSSIALRYGIARSNVGQIVNFNTWKHVVGDS